jgi:hypothetical protein
MRPYQALFATVVTLGLLACGATSGPGDGAPRRQANRISPEEIQNAQTQNAFDMIRSLRPAWLSTRGQQSLSNPTAGQVVVYLDGARAGGVETLRQIQALDIESAQYMNAAEAGSRFGLDHTGGAILITTRRR